MTSVLGVRRPPREWAARSSGPRYASTSTILPVSRCPSTSRTRTLSSTSRATTVVSRAKKDAGRTASSGSSCAKPLLGRVPAALVHIQVLVRHLVHRLPVHALPPRGDADAELHGHGELGVAVQVLERLAHADANLARVALVGVWHRDPELVAAEAATSV